MRRSGTTWLGKIVDSHPTTLYRHEPDSWIDMSGIPYFAEQDARSDGEQLLTQFLAEMSAATSPHIVAKTPFFSKNYLSAWQESRQLLQAFFAKSVHRYLGATGSCYNAIPNLSQRDYRLVWKSVESPTRLAFIASTLKSARALFLIRHPCGYFNSYLRGQDSGKMPKVGNGTINKDIWHWRLSTRTAQNLGLTESSLSAWSRKERMVWEWIIDNQFVLESIRDRENIKVVVYDELCCDPVGGAKDIFNHLNLPWNAQTEHFLNAGKSRQSSAYFSVMKDPATTSTAWQEQLSQDDRDLVLRLVRGTIPARLFGDCR